MNIETIDDILNDLADKLCVYGACKSTDPDGCDNTDPCCCRCGFMTVYADRVYAAIQNEHKLKLAELI